jgi:uncharacterized protein YkwD
MIRRCLLKAIPRCQSAVISAGFFWIATIACAGLGQEQTFTKPDATTPSEAGVPAGQIPPKKKLAQSGVWHHFGESEKAAALGPSQLAVWHSFGPRRDRPMVGSVEPAPRQNLGENRMGDLERQMLALVNQDRLDPATIAETGGRAQPLRWNEGLAAVARAHSRKMLEQRFFAHVDPDGTTLSTRLNEAGILWQVAGENIAIYGTVQGAQSAFMNEPHFQQNHRANILNANFTDVGIGIVKGTDGSLYITQEFAAMLPISAQAASGPSRGL